MTAFRLIFDTGTFVLIWMVQLIVYPSFRYYAEPQFLIWHKKYTKNLTLIVAPLLAGQGLSIAYQFFTTLSVYSFVQSCLITGVMLHTFIYFIPIHTRLQTNYSEDLIEKLILTNWIRTCVWSAIMLIDVAYLLIT